MIKYLVRFNIDNLVIAKFIIAIMHLVIMLQSVYLNKNKVSGR